MSRGLGLGLRIPSDRGYGYEIIAEQLRSKATISKLNEANDLYGHLPHSLQRAVDHAKEKGASSWLTVLPLSDHGFALHKSAFHDATALRYGWSPPKLPSNAIAGTGCLWSMLYPVQRVVSPQLGITRSVTSQLIYSLKSAMMSALSQPCSQCCHNN